MLEKRCNICDVVLYIQSAIAMDVLLSVPSVNKHMLILGLSVVACVTVSLVLIPVARTVRCALMEKSLLARVSGDSYSNYEKMTIKLPRNVKFHNECSPNDFLEKFCDLRDIDFYLLIHHNVKRTSQLMCHLKQTSVN